MFGWSEKEEVRKPDDDDVTGAELQSRAKRVKLIKVLCSWHEAATSRMLRFCHCRVWRIDRSRI